MLNVSNAFNEAFKSDLREVKMRIKINDVTYTDEDIISFNLNTSSIVGETFAIGSTFANSIKLTLCKIVEGLKQLDVVQPEMGIVLTDGSIEYVKLGTFLISEEVNPDRNENRTSLECTDKMIMLDDKYESKLKYPAAIRDVAVEIANLSGVEVDHTSFARLSPMRIAKPEGYTYRQAIGLVAQFEAGYATFNRDGLLAIKQLHDPEFKVTPDEYFLKGLTKNELIFRPSGIEVKINDSEDQTMSIGNKKGSVIKLENKVMTDLLLQSMYENIKNINYYPYTLKWRGNPAVEAGDWLRVTDTRGNEFKVPNLSYSLEYKGGLTATSTVETVASNEVKMGYKSILDQTVEYVNAVIKGVEGTSVYYGVEEPINPKEGDVWFKYNGPDTEILVYEKVAEPDVFDWVFKISSAKDDSIKEAIEELEKQAKQAEKDIEESINKANQAIEQSTLSNQRADEAKRNADAAIDKANEAKQDAFNSDVIARDAKEQSIKAHQLGEGNRTEITKTNEQVQLTSSKVDNQQVELLNLKADNEGIKSSVSKTKSDLDNLSFENRNLIYDSSKEIIYPEATNSYNNQVIATIPESEKTYTISGYVKNIIPSDNKRFSLRVYDKTTTKNPANTTVEIDKDGYFSWTFYLGKDTKDYTIRMYSGGYTETPIGSTMTVYKRKLEYGSKATVYSLSPFELTTKAEFTTFEQNYQGFKSTAENELIGLKSEQVQLSGMVQSTVEKTNTLSQSVDYRNLYLGSDIELKGENLVGISSLNKQGGGVSIDLPGGLQFYRNKKLTFSYDAEIVNGRKGANNYGRLIFELNIRYRNGQISYPGLSLYIKSDGIDNSNFKGRHFGTISIRDEEIVEISTGAIYIQCDGDFVSISNPKISLGDNDTGNQFTLAPEDLATKTQFTQLDNLIQLQSQKVTKNETEIGKLRLESDRFEVEIKKTNGQVSNLTQTFEGFRQTTQNDITGIKSEQVQMASQINMLVTDNKNNSAQLNIQANQINQRVKKGDTISQINQEADRVLISVATNRFMITPETTYIANATIKSAMIDTLTASKLTAGTINANEIAVINVKADNIVSGTLNGIYINLDKTMTIATNGSIVSSYLYGEPYGKTFNARWFDGTSRYGNRYMNFLSNVYDVNSNNTQGKFRHYTETFFGSDILKMRQYTNSSNTSTPISHLDVTANALFAGAGWKNDFVFDFPNGNMFLTGKITTYSLDSTWGLFTHGLTVAAGGGKALQTGRIDAPSSYDTLLINSYRTDMAGLGLTRDRFYSEAIYNKTYSSGPQVCVTSAGTLGRITSAAKYKLDIETPESVLNNAYKLLEIEPKMWFDKYEVESIAEAMSDGNLNDLEMEHQLRRHYGFIADDFHDKGLTEVVTYDEKGEIEGLQYDRISMYHNVILKRQQNEIETLKRQVAKLIGGEKHE